MAKKERNIDLGLKLGFENSYLTAISGPTASAFTAGIAIPIKFSGLNKRQVNLAMFQIAQSEEQFKKAELQIKAEILQAMARYQALCKQVDSFDNGMLEGAQNVRKVRFTAMTGAKHPCSKS